ncbi:hypothetical protein PFICI_02607 [Pestalotiopsis fici W106-1]|uniref:CFEM domain-containing protein n=1 Tax=Pestalotiopsis fici (strain W106-1 / CGMCC3.15140) TaxID=1229662 RepID=W3XGL5_PESFW|nr:uncharacterized protein PFICI_02607 [Pestalotiopsis fici W106-1]ETS84582.1 hypothetical protein PFICI_02607 [Pestalotiopsis fici W106-1]
MWASIRVLVLMVVVAAFAELGIAADASSTTSTSAYTEALSQLPTCALKCLIAAVGESSCSATDVACQCTDAEFVSTAELCVMMSCTIEESLVAKNTTQTMCGAPIRDKSTEYTVVTTVLMSLACIFVLVRLGYRQFFTATDLGLDDWFILLTLLNCVPSAVINVSMLSNYGLGKDIWTLTPDEITSFARGFFIITLLYFSEVFVLKLSMLFFYLRIFPSRSVRRVVLGAVAFDILFGVAFIITALLQCRPISYNWTNWRGEGGGQCIDISAVAWANAAVSIALDLFMLGIPLSQLRQLNLHWKKKVGVALMFCVGTFVTIVSIIRLASLVEFRESTNLTWDYFGVALWSTVEITVGIICACMPAIRLILVRIAPKVFDVTLVRRSKYYYGNRKSKNITASQAARWRASTAWDPKLSQPSTDASKSAASRNSWMPPSVRHSWRVSRGDRIMADGILFSRVAPPQEQHLDEVDEDDQNRLVALEAIGPTKPHSVVLISGGVRSPIHSSRGHSPDLDGPAHAL